MSKDDKPLTSFDFIKGEMLLVDKPKEWTSFDVVNKLRSTIRKKLGIKKIKVGHAGTLDPMATGLLIVCTGKFTKQLSEYQGMPKEYIGTLQLGATTPSYDAETAIDAQFPTDHITSELLERARQQFLGDIEQKPPIFSAIKVDGQPLYKKARKGESVEIKSRPVKIYDFDLLSKDLPNIDFEVKCSKGTYIRSLAYDFGKAVESGAYLTRLQRTKIGEYDVKDAWSLEELVERIKEELVL
ncbi:MAG: tRNA pseudouridine(55) synthase TruB [Bacteroidota bacterium]